MTAALSIAAAAALAAWLVVLPRLTRRLLALQGLQRPNFRGQTVPTAYGLLIVLWTAPALGVVAALSEERRAAALAWLVVLVGLGTLGYIDDRWGDSRAKGVRGHLAALLREGRLTTGLAKAVGGVVVCLCGALLLEDRQWPAAVLAAAIIALCANAYNLLDLRPGRAGAAFLLPAAALLSAQVAEDPLPLVLLVLIPAAAAYPADARARVMLGDTGSNVLGGAMGLGLLVTLQGLPERLALAAALVALHVAAERWSLTSVIAAHPLLARLDGLTGRR